VGEKIVGNIKTKLEPITDHVRVRNANYRLELQEMESLRQQPEAFIAKLRDFDEYYALDQTSTSMRLNNLKSEWYKENLPNLDKMEWLESEYKKVREGIMRTEWSEKLYQQNPEARIHTPPSDWHLSKVLERLENNPIQDLGDGYRHLPVTDILRESQGK